MDAMREKIEAAKQRRSEAEARVAAAEERSKLASQNEAMKATVADQQAELARQSAELDRRVELVNSFPTETQLLKLERRLETLKNQHADVERQAHQTKTAIDAYAVRRVATEDSWADLAKSVDDAADTSLHGVVDHAAEEVKLLDSERILSAIECVLQICEQREAELLELNKQFADKVEEERELSGRIVSLQQRVESEIPRLEAEADRYINAITAAWASEKEALQATYDRLYAVNKEQQHHLVRGTHVKREAASSDRETALSARHNNLSAQLIDARARLQEVIADNAFIKKSNEQLRVEGRAALDSFDRRKTEVAGRLQEARSERQAAEDEARKFRGLKGDLQYALQTIRDTPSGASKTQ